MSDQKSRKRIVVLLNPSAGTLAAARGDDAPTIARQFDAAGVTAEMKKVQPQDLRDEVLAAIAGGEDAVVGGGGDGTLNTIANAVAGSGVPFGVLPLGTHNHFAKELGVPLDLPAAVAALATAITHDHTTDLDVGDVNGRLFLNFCGLGLHPLVVKHRDAQRNTLGRRKFVAMAVALWRVLRTLPVMRARLDAPGQRVVRITPSVIVCNNAHQMEVFGLKDVSRPDRGLLNVYLARSTTKWGVVALAARAAVRRLASARRFEVLAFPQFTLDTGNRHARVSIDGEVTDLRTPLTFSVRRGGLTVLRADKLP